MWVMGNIMLRLDVIIGEVAASTARHEDFLPSLVGTVYYQDSSASLASFDGAHQARGPCAYYDDVEIVHVSVLPGNMLL